MADTPSAEPPSPSSLGSLTTALYSELEPTRRKLLENLLCAEEDRFGALAWQLEMAEAYIKESEARIQRQKELIDELDPKGHNMTLPRELLSNMENVRKLFVQLRDYIDKKLTEREQSLLAQRRNLEKER